MKPLLLAIAACVTLLPSPAVAADAFQPLTAWRAASGAGIPASWQIADGLIRHTPGGGDLVSAESFADFELVFDWRVRPGGNSGVMYRVAAGAEAPYASGPEYQILDNAAHPDGKTPLTSAASAYGLYAPTTDASRPAGEWNASRIVVAGTHVEHWLNGVMVVTYELGSPDWQARVAESKFASRPGYGMAREGHISLQDHGDPVDYRDMRIRRLDGPDAGAP